MGITLTPGKTLALLPDGHQIPSEELQLLADADISLALPDGVVVEGSWSGRTPLWKSGCAGQQTV